MAAIPAVLVRAIFMASSPLLYDARWQGKHGIGRFAAEVAKRCPMAAIDLPGTPLDFWDPLRLRYALLGCKPGHFFSPGFNAPLGRPCSFSLTLHDLIHLEVREERSSIKQGYYQCIVKPAVLNADVVFTVSEYSRQRIAEWSGIALAGIVCVGNGVDSEVFNPRGLAWPHARPYLLYVGNQKPHKNVEGLVQAFALSGLSADFDLFLTGDLSRAVAEIVARLGMLDRVRSLGLVPERDLPSLYRGAHAVIMPSRYEGFGLPVIEAMACGTPVLSSNRTSLPEVGGAAARYFDPDDRESFVEGLRSLRDTGLLSELRARGLRRAGLFDWGRVAGRVMRGIVDCAGHA